MGEHQFSAEWCSAASGTIERQHLEIEFLRAAYNRLHAVAVAANIWLFTGGNDPHERARVACELNRVLIELAGMREEQGDGEV